MVNYWEPNGYANWQNQGYGGYGYGYRQNEYRQIDIIEAINIAVQRVPGEVVSAELDTKSGMQVYEVEIVTAQGVKYEIDVDRQTGNILDIDLD